MNEKPNVKKRVKAKEIEKDSDLKTEELAKVVLAEYAALRSELQWLISGETFYIRLGVTVLGLFLLSYRLLTVTLSNSKFVSGDFDLHWIALIMGCFYIVLSYLYVRQHEEVFVIASYIRNELRRKLVSILDHIDIWHWEAFKDTAETISRGKGMFIPGSRSLLRDQSVYWAKIGLFWVPSLLFNIYAIHGLLGTNSFAESRFSLLSVVVSLAMFVFITSVIMRSPGYVRRLDENMVDWKTLQASRVRS